jgi:hypothetical protein
MQVLWRMRKCKQCSISLKKLHAKEYKDWFYCSHKCIEASLQALGFDGAVHAVHQYFGPQHPVTKQIQKMRKELKSLRKTADLDNHEAIQEKYWLKNLRKAEKCL